MKEGWLPRLKEVIEEDGRSPRSLSIAAGLGPNFISQMFKNGKEPGTEKVAAILRKLDDSAGAYVYLGIRFSAEEIGLLKLLSGVSKESLAHFKGILLSMQSESEEP